MKRIKLLTLTMFLAVAALAAVPTPAAAHSGVSVGVSFFHDSLAPYGQWRVDARYGQVWRPTRIATGWRPYMNGRWLYTDAGWAFDSYEPWGWATFHYGRWVYDPYSGWLWVPGSEWSPAWVDFQVGDGWIGWAPLPPSVAIGVSYGDGGYRSRIDPRAYCFVDGHRFLDTRVDRWVRPWRDNDGYLRRSRGASRFTRYDGYEVNRGLPVDVVERHVRRAVPRTRIVEVRDARDLGRGRERGFAAYRPRVEGQPQRLAPYDVRSGRSRVEVGTVRPPVRSYESRPVERREVTTRRVERPVTRASRPQHFVHPARPAPHVVPRAYPSSREVVRREVRREVVTQRAPSRPHVASAHGDRRPPQVRSQVERRQSAPRATHGNGGSRSHGNGRPRGG